MQLRAVVVVLATFCVLYTASCSCDTTKMDLYLVVDGSGSISPSDFENYIKQFCRDIVTNFSVSDNDVRISLVQFASSARLELGLSGDKASLIHSIDSMVKLGGGTNMHLGLDMAYEQYENHARKAMLQVVLAMTDGVVNSQPLTRVAADEFKSKFVQLFMVGITNNINETFLKEICTAPPDQHYIDYATFAAMNAESFISMACVEGAGLWPPLGPRRGDTELEITGYGFVDSGYMRCGFFGKGDLVASVPATYVSPNKIKCTTPHMAYPLRYSDIDVMVSIDNGNSWFMKEHFTYWSFETVWWIIPLAFLIFIVGTILFALSVLAGFLIAPKLVQVQLKHKGASLLAGADAEVPPVAAEPKWKNLTPSNYIWPGEGGGTKPMPVDWGEKGRVESSPYSDGEINGYYFQASDNVKCPVWCPSFCP